MNDTLRKYDLMKQLGIEQDWEYCEKSKSWYRPCWEHVTDFMAACIFERICREWLEKKSIFVYCFHEPDVDFVNYAFRWLDDADPLYAAMITNNEFYKSFDAAQIAAMEYCLKEGTTKCIDN